MGEPLIIIGNGMAAARLAEELMSRALGRYAVAIVGEEPRLAYNRVLLSSVLANEVAASEIELRPARWRRDRGVTLRYGCRAEAVDPGARTVTLADGTRFGFGQLVFATGSRASTLPLPGIDLPGVLRFRDIDDVDALNRVARKGARVVVIGGGLLGLEAAHGLAKAGSRVAVVHLMDRLMERQLDARAAAMLRRAIEARGITVRTQASTARIVGTHRVEGVELVDGTGLVADVVVVATGITPNVEIARAAGLDVKRGIVVDDRLQTSTQGVHAIGECAEHRRQCYGLVEPVHEQARILARRLAGEDARYHGSIVTTNLKVSGIKLFSAGDFLESAGTEAIVLSDPAADTYKKLMIADDRLVGAVLYGDTEDGPWYFDLIRNGVSIAPFRDDLVFGRALAMRAAAAA